MRTFLQLIVWGALTLLLTSLGLAQEETSESTDEGTESSSETDDEGTDDATDDGSEAEELDGPATWRPTGGSLFGNTSTQQQSSGDDEITGRPSTASDDDADDADDREMMLIFDLYYEEGITFRDRYRQEFENGYEEAIDESPAYQRLPELRKRRLMRDAGVIAVGDLSADRVEEIAVQIGVEHYLFAGILIENRRNYRITVIRGRAGEGEDGRLVLTDTSSRSVPNVKRLLFRYMEEAMAGDEAGE